MKYARRSVSDADIRRYEMFAQVSFVCVKHMLERIVDEACAEPATITLIWVELQVPGELWCACCDKQHCSEQRRIWR